MHIKTSIHRQKGFTLLELLVVISIIGMLSTVILASTNSARAKSRDAKRAQQIHQLDVAVQLYKSNNGGKAPDLQGTCGVMSGSNPDQAQASACFAVSTGGVAWDKFKEDLKPYLSDVPADPCTSCSSGSSYPLGYTYVAPLALQYNCAANSSCTDSTEEISQTYQLYAARETQTTPVGGSAAGTQTFLPIVQTSGSAPTINLSPTLVSKNTYRIDWVIANAATCTEEHGLYPTVDPSTKDYQPWLSLNQNNINFDLTLPIIGAQGGSKTVVYNFINGFEGWFTGDAYATVIVSCTSPTGQTTVNSINLLVEPDY